MSPSAVDGIAGPGITLEGSGVNSDGDKRHNAGGNHGNSPMDRLNDAFEVVNAMFSGTLDSLAGKLSKGDSHVRTLAATALGMLGDPHAVGPLARSLNSSDVEVRRAVTEALGKLGPDAVEPLMGALRDQDMGVRCRACMALGGLRDTRAVEPLLATLQDGESAVRAEAAYALGQIGDSRAVPALISALNDPERLNVARKAAWALGQLGADALPPLLESLRSQDRDARLSAASALGQLGDKRAVPALVEALHDADPYVRTAAADALGSLRSKRSLQALAEALGDEDVSVGRSAAEALMGMSRGAVPVLLEALKSEQSIVRFRVASALGEIGSEEALPELERLAATDDAHVPWGLTVGEAAAKAVRKIKMQNTAARPWQGSTRYEFRLYADYRQFYIGDSQSQADMSVTEFWSPWALENRLPVGPGIVGVGTASYDYVDVVVDITDKAPDDDFGGWDHVAEASLEVPSGGIAIDGCTSYRPEEVRIRVTPGTYRVRVYCGGLAYEGDDHYRLVLWPQAYAEPKVLKKYEISV